jgi:hypothetical protein
MAKRYVGLEYVNDEYVIKQLQNGFYQIDGGEAPHNLEAIKVLRDLLNEILEDNGMGDPKPTQLVQVQETPVARPSSPFAQKWDDAGLNIDNPLAGM